MQSSNHPTTWWSIPETVPGNDLDKPEDMLADLIEPDSRAEHFQVDALAAHAYALPPALRPALSLTPRRYQTEALAAWEDGTCAGGQSRW